MARNGHPRVPRKIRGERRRAKAIIEGKVKPKIVARKYGHTIPIYRSQAPDLSPNALSAWEKILYEEAVKAGVGHMVPTRYRRVDTTPRT